jgi:hypothetical protein
MALSKPRDDIYTYDLSAKNLTAGEGSNAAKRVDGAFFDANYDDINNALGVRASWGADWTDNGSTAAQGIYTTPTGLFDEEHYVVVSDGTNVWLTQMNADDDLRLSDSEIVNGGAGPADYSSSAFIDSLHAWVVKTTKAGIIVDSTMIVLDEDAPNALTGESIKRAAGDSSDLDADLTTVETAFAAEHNASTGAHDDNFISASMLDDDEVFSAKGFVNEIDNGDFSRWPQGPNNPAGSEGWYDYNADSIEQETTHTKFGGYAMKVSTSGANRGVYYEVKNAERFAGRTLSVNGWFKQSAAGKVLIRIEDNAGNTEGDALTLSGSYQRAYCTRTIDSGCTDGDLKVYFVSTDATSPDFYLDGVMGVIGATHMSRTDSTRDRIADDDVVPVNWLLNPNLERWANENADDLPDQWVKHGLGSLDVATGGAGVCFSGSRCLYLGNSGATGAGTGIMQELGDLEYIENLLQGKTVCLSGWFHTDGASNTWRVEIYDGTTATQSDFEASDMTDWTQVCVTATLKAAMTNELELRIYSVDGETSGDAMYVDGLCFNIGSRPMPGAGNVGCPSAYTPVQYVFQAAGELAGDDYVGLLQPNGDVVYPLRMDVYCSRGPGHTLAADTADYILYRGDFGSAPAALNLTAQVDTAATPDADGAGSSATNTLADTDSDILFDTNYIRVYQDLGGNVTDNPEDITVIVSGVALR